MKTFSLLLFTIFIISIFFRIHNLNWDQGFHMHPDERAIIMFALNLSLPKTLEEFLSPTSPLNPHFFAYGSFPLYLVKATATILSGINPLLNSYDGLGMIGRTISSIADIATLLLVFIIGKKIFGKKVAAFCLLFYGLSVFPIQAAHFYAVDILLTFFITLTLYQLLLFYEKPTKKRAVYVGITFGFSLATKISAIALLSAITAALCADFLLIILKNPRNKNLLFSHSKILLKKLFTEGLLLVLATMVTFLILEPYALIDFSEFIKQNMLQSEMTHNAFIFPYTLQYVGKIPYWYELKNVFLWGLGPTMGLLAFFGIGYGFYLLFEKIKRSLKAEEIILLVFFITYFLIVGKFAVGWMRYMMPIYPLFALFGGNFLFNVLRILKNNTRPWLFITYSAFLFLAIFLWPLSFMHIYAQPNTRVRATDWIQKNITPQSTIAIEHWDDALPLIGQENYQMITLSLYDPDTKEKWQAIRQQLAEIDYLIIASNRLYVPLQKLTNCKILPPEKCYEQTAMYYRLLFQGSLGFKKVAEFAVYPTIPLLNIPINDQEADESFTVYDHPKIIIFKKM